MNSYQGQARVNGEVYMKNRRTVLLGLSVGNPHYFKMETLEKLFKMAERNADKVLLFITDKIFEHNYKAVGSKTPEKSAKAKGNKLRKKCKKIMKIQGCSLDKYTFINWEEHVSSNPQYRQTLEYIENLYKNNERFRLDMQERTKNALACFFKGRDNGQQDAYTTESLNLEEGAKYLLEEFAFFSVLHHIYDDCDEYVHVYHRATPFFDRYFEGFYDGQYRPSFGSYIFP